jgi:two-component system sensor histidine kinase HydH
MSAFQWRFLGAVSLGTVCLVALCALTAVSLFHQQVTIANVLREHVSSRRAASDLRGTLNTLIALETNQIESVADLHTRAAAQLQDIRNQANLERERQLSQQLDEGFNQYLQKWKNLPPKNHPDHLAGVLAATRYLELHVLYPCREIEAFNDQQIEEMTSQHERILNQLAWGMVVIAVLAAVAGIVFGYGVARVVNQSIRRLRIQLHDAAGKLGPNPPDIVVTGNLGFGGLHDALASLTDRIASVVQQLHDREREVARAEQLAATGQLAAGVAHELRNPLTSIKMLVQTGLEEHGRLTREDLEVIEAEIRRMERSLQTFLDFARPPRSERRPITLEPILQAVLGLIRGRSEKQRVRTCVESAKEPITLLGDPGQLQQVLINLTLNALDAMPSGGTLTIRTRRVENWAEIEVSDTGRGIAPDMLPQLFEPFASNKETGLGLGLVISRRIIEDHRGSIEAVNLPQGGAKFRIRLPLEPSQPSGDSTNAGSARDR